MFLLTKNGNIKNCKENIALIMIKIINNKVSNVRHYVSNEIGMRTSDFYKGLRKIKEINPKFYDFYEKNLNNNIEIKKEEIKIILYYISIFINYGVELEDGTFRKFDLLDWYVIKNKYFDNLLRQEISAIFDELTLEQNLKKFNIDIKNVRKMVSDSYENNFGMYSRVMDEKFLLNNAHNFLTNEEIQFIIDYFKENNITLNERNYNLAVKKIEEQRLNKNDLFRLEIPSNEIIIRSKVK